MGEIPQALTDYYARIGADVVNFRKAIIRTWHGQYYEERAVIRLTKEGVIFCSDATFVPTKEEAEAIKAAFATIEFPKTISAKSTSSLLASKHPPGELFEFWDRDKDEIIFIQERRLLKNGKKAYIPWVYLSNGEWANMEPDDGLPFWKPRYPTGKSRVMIHEGAKAAKFISDNLLRTDPWHPWFETLAQYEHWGMVGGALAPHRTNYSELAKFSPTETVYVADNDYVGKAALQKVSEAWGRSLKGICFDDNFPDSWDMADPMPKKFFRKGHYIGASLEKFMTPATFATKKVLAPGEEKRTINVISPTFAEEWLHCIAPEVFVHRDWPLDILPLSEFNNKVRPFSGADDTARIFRKDNASKTSKLCYDPSGPLGVFADVDGTKINTYRPSDILPESGSAALWEDFITSLIPSSHDRTELLRWIATLVCRPETKMMYGVLLISETQGIGKGTLGEKILFPLVGQRNCSVPSESEIVDSAFNDWIAHKRLAIIHEIYEGHSSRAYNKLKSTITEKIITVNKKFVASYQIENWIHLFACSNSKRALKFSIDDRRWFFPQLVEKKIKNAEFWRTFNNWLTEERGLQIIRGWLEDFLKTHDPVLPGAEAPDSSLKQEILMESMSLGQQLVVNTLDRIHSNLNGKPFVTTDKALVELIKNKLYDGRQNDRLERAATIRRLVKSLPGWFIGERQIQVASWPDVHWKGHIITTSPDIAEMKPSDIPDPPTKDFI